MNKRSSFKQLISILTCICFVFISLFLITYIVKEANHECSKGKCHICDCILKAEKMLKHLSSNIFNSYIAIIVVLSCLSCLISASLNIKISTPITLKVKMIN